MATNPILITVPVGNNPARVRMLIYFKGLESLIDMKTPADYGGLSSADYRKINPQGKIPSLILPSGKTLFEAKVIFGYINDIHASKGPPVGAESPEDRALAALIVQVHDLYIASPNSSDPTITANQGAMYKSVDVIDGPARAAKLAELDKQLGVLESLVRGPYAVGESITEADLTLWPTLACFLPKILPSVFGWTNPMEDAKRFPRLVAWHAAVGALPAAQKVKAEVDAALDGWHASGRFEPIKEQMTAHADLKWAYP